MRAARLAVVAATALLAGCGSTVVSCGPCAPPVSLGLDGIPADLSVHGTACVDGWGCQPIEGTAGTTIILEAPDGVSAAEVEDLAVTVSVRGQPGSAPRTGEGRFVYRPGGGGECSCSWSQAAVTLARS